MTSGRILSTDFFFCTGKMSTFVRFIIPNGCYISFVSLIELSSPWTRDIIEAVTLLLLLLLLLLIMLILVLLLLLLVVVVVIARLSVVVVI